MSRLDFFLSAASFFFFFLIFFFLSFPLRRLSPSTWDSSTSAYGNPHSSRRPSLRSLIHLAQSSSLVLRVSYHVSGFRDIVQPPVIGSTSDLASLPSSLAEKLVATQPRRLGLFHTSHAEHQQGLSVHAAEFDPFYTCPAYRDFYGPIRKRGVILNPHRKEGKQTYR